MSNLIVAIVRRVGGLFDAAEDALQVWDDLLGDDTYAGHAECPGRPPAAC